jgi:hypothetical protein
MGRIRSLLARLVFVGLVAALLTPAIDGAIAHAYTTNGWRWCDGWADVSPNTQVWYRPYTLATSPVSDAATRWTYAGLGTGGKVNFDFYFYHSDASTKIRLYSYDAGNNGRLAYATWGGWPWCFGSGEIEFNKWFYYNPPTTSCVGYQGWYYLESVALHELGHLVGLDHSGDVNAIMYQSIPNCTWKYLNSDDESGIISIYGRR